MPPAILGLVTPSVPEQRVGPVLFTAAEVCQQAGITYRNLDYWLRAKHVDLDEDHERLRTPGSGYPRRFTLAETQRFALLARFMRAGFRLEVAATLVRRFEASGRDDTPISLVDGVVLVVSL